MENHIILNYLDSPIKILVWTRSELLLFIAPFILGLCFSQVILGMVLSCLNYFLYQKFFKQRGNNFYGVWYWYLPRGRLFESFPPSFIRFFVG